MRKPARHPVCVTRHPKSMALGVWPQATVRPGTDVNGGHINVVWMRIDLGAGPEWLQMGTLRGGWA